MTITHSLFRGIEKSSHKKILIEHELSRMSGEKPSYRWIEQDVRRMLKRHHLSVEEFKEWVEERLDKLSL
jgi:hypothetical protein